MVRGSNASEWSAHTRYILPRYKTYEEVCVCDVMIFQKSGVLNCIPQMLLGMEECWDFPKTFEGASHREAHVRGTQV